MSEEVNCNSQKPTVKWINKKCHDTLVFALLLLLKQTNMATSLKNYMILHIMVSKGQKGPPHHCRNILDTLQLWPGIYWDHKRQHPQHNQRTWKTLQTKTTGKISSSWTCPEMSCTWNPISKHRNTGQNPAIIMLDCTDKPLKSTNISTASTKKKKV